MTATTSSPSVPAGVRILGGTVPGAEGVLTGEAVAFVAALVRAFAPRRDELMARRKTVQARLDAGQRLDFLAETRAVREASFQGPSIPADLRDRRVEITGP